MKAGLSAPPATSLWRVPGLPRAPGNEFLVCADRVFQFTIACQKWHLLGSQCQFRVPSSFILSVSDTELVRSAPILRPDAPPWPGDPRDISGGSPGREKLPFFDPNRSLLIEIYILGVKIVNIILGGRDWRVVDRSKF